MGNIKVVKGKALRTIEQQLSVEQIDRQISQMEKRIENLNKRKAKVAGNLKELKAIRKKVTE